MTLEENITAALESGRQKADEILALRAVAQSRRADALQKNHKKMALRVQLAAPGGPQTSAEFQTAGFLAAAGDSWFDYPFHDVLKLLEDHHGYNVESTAHKGDPIEKIAYAGGQLEAVDRFLTVTLAPGRTFPAESETEPESFDWASCARRGLAVSTEISTSPNNSFAVFGCIGGFPLVR